MNLELKDAGTARKIAIVTFDAKEIQSKESEACREIGRLANIPGFRKGKAPPAIIRKKYSKELKDDQKIHIIQTGWFANDFVKNAFVDEGKRIY